MAAAAVGSVEGPATTSSTAEDLPGWSDDAVMRARFRAFEGGEEGWPAAAGFWADAVASLARTAGRLIIDVDEVKNLWFRRKGVVPLSLDLVLADMLRKGQLLPASWYTSPLAGDPVWWQASRALYVGVKWAYNATFGAAFGAAASTQQAHKQLLVSELLEASEAGKHALNLLQEPQTGVAPDTILPLAQAQQLLQEFNTQDVHVILRHLIRQASVRHISTTGSVGHEGIKVAAEGQKVCPRVTEHDRRILHLKCVQKTMQRRSEAILTQIAKSRDQAKAAAKAGDRRTALQLLQRKHALGNQSMLVGQSLQRVDEVLEAICAAETSQQVMAAYKAGLEVLRTQSVSIDVVEEVMEDLDEVAQQLAEVSEALAVPTVDKDVEDEYQQLQQALEELTVTFPTAEPVHAAPVAADSPAAVKQPVLSD
eukprot:jgi/Chlat1/705/Chrsp104S00020